MNCLPTHAAKPCFRFMEVEVLVVTAVYTPKKKKVGGENVGAASGGLGWS